MANENEGGESGAGTGGEAAAAASATAASAAAAAKGTATGASDQGASGTASGDAAATAAAAAAKGTKELGWGETWRKDYAGTDEKLLKRLERYASPKAAIDALVAAQNRINSGELKAPLPDKPTPEQVAEYRKEHGIPEKPEGYLENLPQGLVIGDADKPIFEDFVKGLHELNADPKLAHYAVKWYNDFQEKTVTAQIEGDEVAKSTTEDQLRAEWGNDYRTNINSIHGLLDGAPKEVSEVLLNARGGDGKAIMNDPQIVRWLVSVARELNPVHTIVPGSGADSGKSINDEIGSIEKEMRENRSAYNKNEAMQSRYRELLDARSRIQSRSAA